MHRSSSALRFVSDLSTLKLLTSSFLTLVLCLLILSTLSFAAADRITGLVVAGQTVDLARSVHPRALPKYDLGAVDPQLKFNYVTLLTSPSPSQQRALDRLTADQQNPSSPNYHKWLTPAQYADRFGLSQNDIDKITTWLKEQGFTVISVGGGRNSIIFSGTALQIETAFQTPIHRYNIDGEEHFSNATPVKIPAAWAGVVTGVRGLNSFRWKAMGGKNLLHRNYYDSSFNFDFVAPGDIATLYDINPLYNATPHIDGSGQTLAIIGQTDIYLSDINDFRTGFGLSAIPSSTTPTSGSCTVNSSNLLLSCSNAKNLGYVLVGTDPGAPDTCGDLSEADLDVEWSGATARNAQIIYVNAPAVFIGNNCNNGLSSGGTEDALAYAIAPPNNAPPIAPVISMSYGLCELLAGDDEVELQHATSVGVTIVNSSGDNGAAACDPSTNINTNNLAVFGPAVNYPASSQYVTGVGGTAVPFIDLPPGANSSTYWGTTNGTTGGSLLPPPAPRVPEEAWNDVFEFGNECEQDPTSNFCVSSGITSPLTAQESLGIGAGGGGASNCVTVNVSGQCTGGFPQPSWQTVTVSGQASARFVPDVSLLASANFPGYIFCTEESELTLSGTGTGSVCANGIASALAFTDPSNNNLPDPPIVGGTSVSTPIFAGMVVLLNQYLGNSKGMGNINPTLYLLAKTKSNNYFHQLTTGVDTGNNEVYCFSGQPSNQPLAYQCPGSGVGLIGFSSSNSDSTTGYNLVNGLGSVDLDNLAIAWATTLPNFTLSDSPGSLTITQGGAGGTSTITVHDLNGFNGNVTLAASGLPSGVTAAFNPNPTASTSTLMLTADATATPGTSTVTITGTSGSLTPTTTLALTVNATPNFTLSDSPTSLSITQGGAAGTSTVTVTDVGGFNGSVTLAASGLPSGVTAAFNPNPTTSTSTLSLTASASATPGAATVTITGTSGTLNATTTLALTVNQNFNVPGPLTDPPAANPGQSTSTTMSISTASGGAFSNPVTYACSGLPTGATCSFSPPQILLPATSPQSVTITVQTAGPFTGVAQARRRASSRRAALSQNQRLWLPLSLPLAGMLLVGLMGRGLPRHYKIVGLCLALALAGFLAACGGGSSTPAPVVTVSPNTVNTLYPDLTGAPAQFTQQQFSATVSNTTSQTVAWAVSGTGNGSIDQTGLYTAPATLPNPNSAITITATSTATATPGTATVHLLTPTPAVTNQLITVTVTEGSLQKPTTFHLTVN